MFEHQSKPLLPLHAFIARLSCNVGVAIILAFISLFVGMIGYRYFEDLPWVDAFLNASMILGGMGEIDPLKTDGGKIFAGCYALYSGLWLVASMGLILSPVFHRILHHFHSHRPPGQ
ncbi:MAG: hypothetical protein ACAH83_03485 [Alphaproteobacteria bacterium]